MKTNVKLTKLKQDFGVSGQNRSGDPCSGTE